MRVSRLSLLSALVLLACTETAGPGNLPLKYSLNDIDGRALPAPVPFTPNATVILLSSALSLDLVGNATFIDRRIEPDGTDHFVTARYRYRIDGPDVSFTPPPCPGLVMCALIYDLSGKVIGRNLTIVVHNLINDASLTLNYQPLS